MFIIVWIGCLLLIGCHAPNITTEQTPQNQPVSKMVRKNTARSGFTADAKHSWRFARKGWSGVLDADGALRLTSSDAPSLKWSIAQWGRHDKMNVWTNPSVSVEPSRERINWQSEGLTAWFKHTPESLMQGFDLKQRPKGTGPLQVHLHGSSTWSLRGHGQNIVATYRADPKHQWRYGQLIAWDSRGKALPARMFARGQHVVVEIDDVHANYPITIDPIFERVALSERVVNHRRGVDAHYGEVIVMDGAYAVISAPNQSAISGGFDVHFGKVFLYENRNPADAPNWVLVDEIVNPIGGTDHQFGASLSFNDGYLAIGVPGMDGDVNMDEGAVYVTSVTNGRFDVPRRINVGLQPNDRFGTSVYINATHLIVGAPGTSTANGNGAVYTFARNMDGNYLQDNAPLTSSTANAQSFGAVIAYDDFFLAVSDPDATIQGLANAGQVQLFRTTDGLKTWQMEKVLTSPAPFANGGFGRALGLESLRLLVGEPGANGQGAAHLYVQSGGNEPWGLWQTFQSPNPVSNGLFGQHVLHHGDGDLVMIGSPGARPLAADDPEGGIFIFERQDDDFWGLRHQLSAPDRRIGGGFGRAFGYSGQLDAGVLLAGRPTVKHGDDGAGVVDVFYFNSPEPWRFDTSLENEIDMRGGEFGFAVDATDGWMIVGAPKAFIPTDGRSAPGRVFLYQYDAQSLDRHWVPFDAFESSSPKVNGRFGQAVAIDNQTLAFANNPANSPGGQVKIYEYDAQLNQWTFKDIFASEDSGTSDRYGWSLALEGDTLVVGSPRTTVEMRKGRAAVITRNNGVWSQLSLPLPPNIPEDAEFGRDVAVNPQENAIVVGALKNGFGGAWVYDKQGQSWVAQELITSTAAGNLNKLGYAVAANDQTILVSDPYDNNKRGKVHVFVKDAALMRWVAQTPLVGTFDGQRFGSALAVSNDILLISDEAQPNGQSNVHVFHWEMNQWRPFSTPQLTAPKRGPSQFGQSLALHDDRVFIGQHYNNNNASSLSGAVFTYTFDGAAPTPRVPNQTYDLLEDTMHAEQVSATPTGTYAYRVIVNPSHGQLTMDQDTGAITYQPNPNYNGTDYALYQATSSDGQVSNTGALIFVIRPTDDDLGGADQMFMVEQGQSITEALMIDNIDNKPLTLKLETPPESGQVMLDNDVLQFVYQAPDDEVGPVFFEYSVSNGTQTIPLRVDLLIEPRPLTMTSPTSPWDDSRVIIAGQATVGHTVNITLTGESTFSTMATPTAMGTYEATLEDVPNGTYTIEVTQPITGISPTPSVKEDVIIDVLGVEKPTVENGVVGDDGVIEVKDGEPVVLQGVLPEDSTVTITVTDENGKEHTFDQDDPNVTVKDGQWRFQLPDEFIGQEIDVVVTVTNTKTNKKAVLRLRVRSSTFNPLPFERQGCQHVPGHPLQSLWWVGLVVLGVGRRRRAKKRCHT